MNEIKVKSEILKFLINCISTHLDCLSSVCFVLLLLIVDRFDFRTVLISVSQNLKLSGTIILENNCG